MQPSPLEQKEIAEILSEFGLTAKEQQVYSTLLRQGKSQLVPLSRAANIGVTTLQSILVRLFERGLIQVTKRKSRNVYEAYDPSVFKKILQERLENGIRLKSLRVEAQEIKKYSRATDMRELREAKFLPRDMNFRATILFWDNTVAFFGAKDEGLAWIVESASIREMIGQLFNLLWSVSRPMETQ